MRVDEIVDRYIRLRDKKAKMKADYDASVKDIDNALDQLEALVLQNFQETGMTSCKTDAGTAYTSKRTSATVADWDAFFHNFVLPNQAWELIERRPSKTAVDQYREAHGDLPPGINYSETVTVNVRRS